VERHRGFAWESGVDCGHGASARCYPASKNNQNELASHAKDVNADATMRDARCEMRDESGIEWNVNMKTQMEIGTDAHTLYLYSISSA
jgi:nucleoside 2-deoxyribosyltransferase